MLNAGQDVDVNGSRDVLFVFVVLGLWVCSPVASGDVSTLLNSNQAN